MKKTTMLLVCAALVVSCKETPPEPPKPPTLSLKVEDASCTEAWLKFSTTETPATVRLLRDDQRISDLRLLTSDSLVVTEGLLPKHTYAFQLQKLAADSNVIETSTRVQLTTMDTSSHDWHFDIDTLGVTSSVLYDVAIISDTNMWAVGEIFLNDSVTGQLDPVHYNAAHWDGTRWNIMRLFSDCRLYWPNCGPVYFTASPGKAIFAFAANDIWIVAGGVHHFDGIRWTEQRAIVEVGATNKIWGSNSNDMWFVGNGGIMIHKSGSTWQRVESGTTLHMYDVKGGGTGSTQVVAVAGRLGENFERGIFGMDRDGIVAFSDRGIRGTLHGVWFAANRKYYVVGEGIYSKNSIKSTESWVPLHGGVTDYFAYDITATASNDMIVCGSFGELLHFNGYSWKSYHGATSISAGAYYATALAGNLCIAVGYESPRAVVAVGRRF